MSMASPTSSGPLTPSHSFSASSTNSLISYLPIYLLVLCAVDAIDAQGPRISCTNTASETLNKATDDGGESRLEGGNLQKKHSDDVSAPNPFDLSAISGLLNVRLSPLQVTVLFFFPLAYSIGRLQAAMKAHCRVRKSISLFLPMLDIHNGDAV